MTKNVRYTSEIYFPQFVTPPTPCSKYSRTQLIRTPHGLVRIVISFDHANYDYNQTHTTAFTAFA